MNPTRARNHTGTAGIAPSTSTWTGTGIADNGRADCGAGSLRSAKCWSRRNIPAQGHWHRHCGEPPPQPVPAVPDDPRLCGARSSCPGTGCGRGKNRRSKFLHGNIGRGRSDSTSGPQRTSWTAGVEHTPPLLTCPTGHAGAHLPFRQTGLGRYKAGRATTFGGGFRNGCRRKVKKLRFSGTTARWGTPDFGS